MPIISQRCLNNLLWALLIGMIVGSCFLIGSTYTGDEAYTHSPRWEPTDEVTARDVVRAFDVGYVAQEGAEFVGDAAENMSIKASTMGFMTNLTIGGFVGGFLIAFILFTCWFNSADNGEENQLWISNTVFCYMLGLIILVGGISALAGHEGSVHDLKTEADMIDANYEDLLKNDPDIHGKYAAVYGGAGVLGCSAFNLLCTFLWHRNVVADNANAPQTATQRVNPRVRGTPGIELSVPPRRATQVSHESRQPEQNVDPPSYANATRILDNARARPSETRTHNPPSKGHPMDAPTARRRLSKALPDLFLQRSDC